MPEQLQCEYLKDPLGIDTANPRFSWIVSSSTGHGEQSAYQIKVASSKEKLENDDTDVWYTERVTSSEQLNIEYGGSGLEPHTRYFWKVRLWDQEGNASGWSKPSWFETGKIGHEWDAQWISDGSRPPENDEAFYDDIPVPLFRKEFEVQGKIKKARLYITGLGYYEAYLNGEKIGDHVLDPAWTNYGKRIKYVVYDVSEQLVNGKNILGVMLGNGWYNPLPLRLFGRWNLREILSIGQPKFISELRLTYEDGTIETITSDPSWKTGKGPILFNNVYLGERYDARQEQSGWKTAGFDESGWNKTEITEAPGGKMEIQTLPAIKITKEVKPISVFEPEPGVYIYDLGQNFAGWIRFKLNAEEGQAIKLRYGELLFEDSTMNGLTAVACQIKEMWNMDGGPGAPKTAWQEDTYIGNGMEFQVFEHHFTFHGFRYVEVKGLTYRPEVDDLIGLRLNADLQRTGTFECSSGLFNDIYEMTDWTFLSNVFSIQSDCPAREKFGYGGDIVAVSESYMFNYDMANFYKKTVEDFMDDVRENGGMPETAPYNAIQTKGLGGDSGPIGWQLAHPFVQEKLYQYYGDRRIIEQQYPVTKRLIEFLRTVADDHFIEIGISDHASVAPKPEPLTSTAFYYHHVILLERFAEILEKTEDQEKYNELADNIKEAFIQRFVNIETGEVGDDPTQITQVFALYYDLIPEETRVKALNVLLNKIDEQDGHLTTGIFGTNWLLNVLRRYDKTEYAYRIASRETFPGWGWMLANGATTLWEDWEGRTNAPSHNHPMFGSINEWFYRVVLGINPADNAYGFDKIILKPQVGGDLNWAGGSYNSVRGLISSKWEKKENEFIWEVEVPPNTKSEINIPLFGYDNFKIYESTNIIDENGTEDLEFVEKNEKYILYNTTGGKYQFKVIW